MNRIFGKNCKLSVLFVVIGIFTFAGTVQAQPGPIGQVTDGDTTDTRLEKYKDLKKEQKLFEQELKTELQKLQAERKRLEERYKLMIQKQKNKLADIRKKKMALGETLSLDQKEHEQSVSEAKQTLDRLETQMKLSKTKSDSALQEIKAQQERLKTELSIEEAERQKALSDLNFDVQKQELLAKLENAKASLKEAKLNNRRLEQQMELSRLESEYNQLEAEMKLGKTRSQSKKQITDPIAYQSDPVVDGTLYVTDRRIDLNGPIISQTGDWVTERLHYFNNQSEKYPIYIVIDDSPGGSVLEGFRIIKAMKSIEAPVYVVVKERAMSMAAGITAMADKSFTFPNAMILHHEIRSYMGGSLTESEEGLKLMKRVWRRLAEPIAQRMDMTVKEFRDRLYEENSNGNWREFGNDAQELNWVDQVVTNIEDVSVREEPSADPPSPSIFFLEADHENIRQDEEGNYYRKLPPLRPHDFYFMYDPGNNYRW